MMGYGMMDGYGYGFGLIGMILNLAIIIGIVWLVIWAVRRFTSGTAAGYPAAGAQSPREILQLRYARGEITRDQYQQMLKDLG
jgi:putative membrane protein